MIATTHACSCPVSKDDHQGRYHPAWREGIMLCSSVHALVVPAAFAQGTVMLSYDIEAVVGDDVHPICVRKHIQVCVVVVVVEIMNSNALCCCR